MGYFNVYVKRFHQFTALIFFILLVSTVRLYIHLRETQPALSSTNSSFRDASPNLVGLDTSDPNQNLTIWQVQECWTHLLITSFIQPHLDHLFSESTLSKSNANPNLPPNCMRSELHTLLLDTESALDNLSQTQGFTFHNLISLRRAVMLVSDSQDLDADSYTTYKIVLELTSDLERNFVSIVRHSYPLFNIHLPRSAGTTLCYQFQLAAYYQGQKASSLNVSPTKPITLNTNPMHNCNIGDGFPFYQYLIRSHEPKTCTEQYNMAQGYNMFARESPLYPNNEPGQTHADLCGQFVYILPVRSPIERILSWIKIDAAFYPYNSSYPAFTATPTHEDGRLELENFIDGFFDSVFDYELNPPHADHITVQHADGSETKMKTQSEWFRGYASNALTRWIGYEFNERELRNNELVESMRAHKDTIGEDDIHFYNAIRVMLQVDYVLNFASYGQDDSTLNALKYGLRTETHAFENLVNEDVTKILDPGNEGNVWNMFGKHLNEHYETDVFDWNRTMMASLAPSKNALFDMMTPGDWEALYDENYFDFRLYSLAKMIGKTDVEYYKQHGW